MTEAPNSKAHASASDNRENRDQAIVSVGKDQILKQRALAAAKKQDTELQEKSIEVVEFMLGPQVFAFEMQHLREVCTLVYVTPIPGSPAFALGVISLHGQIVPVIELRELLGLNLDAVTVFNKAIILQNENLIVGFLADEVVGARVIKLKETQDARANSFSSEYVKAITGERVVILDSARILADRRLNGSTIA